MQVCTYQSQKFSVITFIGTLYMGLVTREAHSTKRELTHLVIGSCANVDTDSTVTDGDREYVWGHVTWLWRHQVRGRQASAQAQWNVVDFARSAAGRVVVVTVRVLEVNVQLLASVETHRCRRCTPHHHTDRQRQTYKRAWAQ